MCAAWPNPAAAPIAGATFDRRIARQTPMTGLRSLLFTLYLWGSALVLGVLCLPALLDQRASMAVSKVWARSCLGALRLLCGLDYRVENPERLPRGAGVVAVKHQAMWETLALTVLLDQPCFVLKKELASIPVFGWYCRADGFLFIDRAAGAKALREMTAGAKAAAAREAQLIIFPEGTRVPPGKTKPYQPGVAALVKVTGLPCVPIAHDAGMYWRHPGLVRLPGTVTLRVLEPIPADTPRAALLRELEARIEPASRALEAAAPHPLPQPAESAA